MPGLQPVGHRQFAHIYMHFVLALAFILTNTAFASTQDFLSWSNKTLKRNPDIKIAFHQWKALAAAVDTAGSLSDPVLSFDYFIDEVQTRTGAQEYRFMLSQHLPWFGKRRLDADTATLRAAAAWHQLSAETDRIKLMLSKIWAQGVNTENQIQISLEELTLLKQIERIARVKYRLARTEHPDLIRIQIKRGRLENKLDRLRQTHQSLRFNLEEISNFPIPVDFRWPKKLPKTQLLSNDNYSIANLTNTNPKLQSQKLNTQISMLQEKQAALKTKPNFTLKYGRIFTSEALNPNTEGSGDDPQYLGVGINIPLWSSKNEGTKAIAHERQLLALQKQRSLENSLKARLSSKWYEVQTTESQLSRYQSALIPQAETALTSTLKSYQTGNGGFSELIDTEKALLELKREAVTLKRDLWLAHQEINALIGQPIKGAKQ